VEVVVHSYESTFYESLKEFATLECITKGDYSNREIDTNTS